MGVIGTVGHFPHLLFPGEVLHGGYFCHKFNSVLNFMVEILIKLITLPISLGFLFMHLDTK
jgi:hypothetical protein